MQANHSRQYSYSTIWKKACHKNKFFMVKFFFQIFEKKQTKYRQSVESADSSPVISKKRSKQIDGAEVVKNELDSLNQRYMEMVSWTDARLKQINISLLQADIDVQVSAEMSQEGKARVLK